MDWLIDTVYSAAMVYAATWSSAFMKPEKNTTHKTKLITKST
jgi:hypothetical protein